MASKVKITYLLVSIVVFSLGCANLRHLSGHSGGCIGAQGDSLKGMSSPKSTPTPTRTAVQVLVTGLIVTLLWPLVSNLYVHNSYDVPEACARVGGSGDQVRYEFFPPRMLCSTVSGGDDWLTETDPRLTLILSVVLMLAVTAMVVGVVLGVRAVPRIAPAASAANFAYVAGSLPSLLVRRLRRLCGLLSVVSVLSPAWMFQMAFGAAWKMPDAVDLATQIPDYVVQVVLASVLPVLALALGVAGWVVQVRTRVRGRGATSDAAVVLVAPVVLLGLTLTLGLGSIATTVSDAERYASAMAARAQVAEPPAPGDVELVLPPDVPPVEPPEQPSMALTPVELEQQFAAFVGQTAARFGPAFEEPVRQGAIPGAALDLAVAAAPYAFDCLGTGIGYGMELTFSGEDADDWDVNYNAAEAAFLRITEGWATDGYPGGPEDNEYFVTADEPSVVSQLSARHFGSTVRVGMQSLCVAR